MGHPPKRVRSVGAFKTTPLIGAIKEKQKPANPFIRPFIGVRSLLISSTVPLCWDFLWFPLFFMDVFVSTASTVLNLTFCFQCIYLINIAFSFICLFPGEFASVDILSVCAGQACLAKKNNDTHTHNLCLLFCNNSHFHSNDWEELVKLFGTTSPAYLPASAVVAWRGLTTEKKILKISWCLESFQIFPNQGYQQKSAPPKFNGKRFWKMIVICWKTILSFWFIWQNFQGRIIFSKQTKIYTSLGFQTPSTRRGVMMWGPHKHTESKPKKRKRENLRRFFRLEA